MLSFVYRQFEVTDFKFENRCAVGYFSFEKINLKLCAYC